MEKLKMILEKTTWFKDPKSTVEKDLFGETFRYFTSKRERERERDYHQKMGLL